MRVLLALLPSAGVLFLFWLAIRAMIQADRRERAAQAKMTAAREASTSVETDPDAPAGPNG